MLNASNVGNQSALARAATSVDTLLYLPFGEGARFALGSGDHFYATLRLHGRREMVRVSSSAQDILTVERGQDGTVAQGWPAGACISVEWNPAQLGEFIDARASGLSPTGVSAGTYCLGCNTCIDVGADGRISAVNNPGGCA